MLKNADKHEMKVVLLLLSFTVYAWAQAPAKSVPTFRISMYQPGDNLSTLQPENKLRISQLMKDHPHHQNKIARDQKDEELKKNALAVSKLKGVSETIVNYVIDGSGKITRICVRAKITYQGRQDEAQKCVPFGNLGGTARYMGELAKEVPKHYEKLVTESKLIQSIQKLNNESSIIEGCN
jgi:hypothetical protein